MAPPSAAAPLDAASIRARLAAGETIQIASGRIPVQRYDFSHSDGSVEALLVRPVGSAAMPGLVLIPGYSRTAYDLLPVAVRFARAGFATLSVSQPGFGGSTGPADFSGPRTFAAVHAAAQRFAAEPFVDPTRLGLYGYSRGALAAAQLATRTDLFRAAVLGGGIYDFAAAYRQVTLPGIRSNMVEETGMTEEAVRFRSPIHDVEGLDGPVLIVHGADDLNAPPEQARALADRLRKLGRPHELIIIAGGTHSLSVNDIATPAIGFFQRHLSAGTATRAIN
ncbi:MAG: alpha/beta fold hydrolase [Pseudomonadota bacterium]|nr:alpha/beta fold hydrolase [Pseudomonadota bacterium]